ncbi:MAG TPA: haloacid dehalogenase type II [Candidatus Angelobacter sp.]
MNEQNPKAPSLIQAIVFDVFGTLMDWRTSLIRRFRQLGGETALTADWAGLVDDWRSRYQPLLNEVRSGKRPWTYLDDLHRESLEQLLPGYGLAGLSDSQKQSLVQGWHFLDPWPDTVAGLTRLKKKFIIGTLSNGGLRLLTDMARYANLPWDAIFSADLFRHYKPASEVYLGAAALLDSPPQQVMLVAAHNYDLAAARRCGFKTAFVPRSSEYGPRQSSDLAAESDWDHVATDLLDLATQLGA